MHLSGDRLPLLLELEDRRVAFAFSMLAHGLALATRLLQRLSFFALVLVVRLQDGPTKDLGRLRLMRTTLPEQTPS